MALQRERRKRRSDRRGRSDDGRVIHLEGEDQDQGGGQEGRDRKGRDQKAQDRDRKERGQEDRDPEGRGQEDEDQGRKRQERDQEAQDHDQKGRDQEDRDRDQDEEDQGRERRGRRTQPLPALEVLEAAKDQLTVLTGRVAESVSGVRGSDNGWRMKIDLVELERIPPSTSLMATYAVELDREGNVVGYEQERRYLRGQADD